MRKLVLLDLIVSICLFVAGFIVPPTGVIDPSVLTAGGILTATVFAENIPLFIKSKKEAKITHGSTSLEIK